MRIRQDQQGFVLSGTALLLILPAMLLTASFFEAVTVGGESAYLQATSDKVFYTGKDIERVIKDMWTENIIISDNTPVPNPMFDHLADNYEAATGLIVDITPRWMLWSVKDDSENRFLSENDKIERVGANKWRYRWDTVLIRNDNDDPILLVEKLNDNLRITLEDFDTVFPLWKADIYYDDIKLWDDVVPDDPRIGENVVVDGTTQLIVSINVRDPRGAARYSSTVELG
ncbi:hypothetical protein AKJ48_03290 [candidate division MSBL1 archaeon SCGC-AAA261O19]|uniref:Uncharacterized protein n=2 Tax=candidate division MSBL1 TaxID=215777 RepID=A0A133V0X1_9EURY|nr:hypothetical protein AKJ42_01640 [candidate division MSBL1 archaeon SCGC-AAA261C02]KXB04178.1 hypothetical protein AKJ48_03290 [candidate division MSBL1 archaeon SCGC-AAA261O19]